MLCVGAAPPIPLRVICLSSLPYLLRACTIPRAAVPSDPLVFRYYYYYYYCYYRSTAILESMIILPPLSLSRSRDT